MSTMLEKKTEEFQRQYLAELLNQCTEKQKVFFNEKVFPNGISLDKLPSAISLCERTLGLHK